MADVLLLGALLVTVWAAPPPVESLSWLPANTVAITGAPRDQVSPLKWLRGRKRRVGRRAAVVETLHLGALTGTESGFKGLYPRSLRTSSPPTGR
jgi:hypothetical protein